MIGLIPKQEEKPLFSRRFFKIASVLLLLGVGIGYYILIVLEGNAQEISDGLEKTLVRDTQPQEAALATELRAYEEKIDRFRMVANLRGNFLADFALLERSTHGSVFFTEFSKDRTSQVISVKGVAESFFTLEQQRLLWKQQEEITSVDILNMELDKEGHIQFEADIHL